jgi:repressor LexA
MVKITSLQSRVLQFILQNIDTAGVPPTLREISRHFGWKAVGSAQDVLAALRKKGFLEPVDKGRARQTIPTDAAYRMLGSVPRSTEMAARTIAPALGAPASFSAGSAGASRSARLPRVQTLWDHSEEGAIHAQSTHDLPQQARVLSFAREDGSIVVPLVGTVRAGLPQEAIAQPDGYVTLPRHPRMRNESLFFAVEVEGYSMIGAGMLPGDVLLVEGAVQAKSGDLALAAVGVDQEVTLKRFALKGSPHYRDAIGRTAFADEPKERWPPALLVPENDDFEPIPFGTEVTDRIVGLVRSLYRQDV